MHFDVRCVEAVIRKAYSSTNQVPGELINYRGWTYVNLVKISRLPCTIFKPLSCRSQHPGNLANLSHHPYFKSRQAEKPEMFLFLHIYSVTNNVKNETDEALSLWGSCEKIEPSHRGGAGI